MSLRNSMSKGIPLSQSWANIGTIFFACCIPVMFYMVWFKWLYFIPEGLQAFIVAIDVCFYIGSCAYRVEEGRARAQLFNGKYTGVAFLFWPMQ